jgi:uncharacterized protein YkwD
VKLLYVLLILAFVGTVAGAAADPGTPVRNLFEALNGERARAGAPPFRLSVPLSSVAQAHAEAMARRGSLRSERGEEDRTQQEMVRAGYRAERWIESEVASDGSLAEIVDYWKQQSGATYPRVMKQDFRDLGIGVVRFGGQTLYTLLFAVPEADYYRERTAALKDLAVVRQGVLERVNAERRKAGRRPLALDARLDEAAERHAEDMLARDYFAHESPEGKTVRQRAVAAGYDWQAIGENIAEGQLSVDQVMQGWMESPHHRDNILSRDFTQLGVGLAMGEGPKGFRVVWVQTFGYPKERR